MEILDPTLNRAVLAIAAKLAPGGFEASENAPSTLAELTAHLKERRPNAGLFGRV